MNNQALATDQEAIRRAQHEWRQAKRRELEAKARKKQYNKRRNSLVSLPQHPSASQLHPHVHPSLYSNPSMSAPTTSVSPTHPVSIQPGLVLSHPTNPSSPQLPLHTQSSLSLAHHPHQPHSQLHHTNIAPAPSMDPSTAAALQIQHHLNANAKRPHMAMHDGQADDDPDAAVAARAAAAHAAASAVPGDAQFAQTFANVTGQPPNPTNAPTTTDPNRVSDLNADRHVVQSEATRRMSEQLEAQRQWREAKRREIAAKKAKGAASKRGRKKARTSAPAHNLNTMGMQGNVTHASTHHSMPQMHMSMPHAYMRDATVQAAGPISHGVGAADEHQSGLYESVHDVQNVERMFQGSVEDGVGDPTSTHAAPFARPAHESAGASAHAKREDGAAVTTELLAATTEAALNAVSEANDKPEDLRNLAIEAEQPRKDFDESSSPQKKTGNEADDPKGAGSGRNVADDHVEKRDGESVGIVRVNRKSNDRNGKEADAIRAMSMQGSRGESPRTGRPRETRREAGSGGDDSATQEQIAQSRSREAGHRPNNGDGETGKDRDSLGFGSDGFTKSRNAGDTGKESANSGQSGQAAEDSNQIRMSGDPESELKEDALDVAGDGGEDIMTADAWQSLDSISHT